jgi:hypothetical protein
MASDSTLVGHYKFTAREWSRLVFDIPEDDPRVALLEALTAPREVTTEIAATVVSSPRRPEEERRYLAYWLGYRVTGAEVQSLSALQWDSIFEKVGRQAVLRFSPLGHPTGVEVGAGAVLPVGQALVSILKGLALALPADSVARGSVWEDSLVVPVSAPDGSQKLALVRVSYSVREFVLGPGGPRVRIEFDGEPLNREGEAAEFSGRYYGESLFAVWQGRYERLMARAELEAKWADSSGLPPSRSVVDWQAEFNRN